MTAAVPTDARPMALVKVPDGAGGYRHEFRPVSPELPKKKKRQRHVPDPIQANPDHAAQQLQQIIERWERLEEERRGIAEDISDVKAEAKAIGFDVRACAAIIKLRRMRPDDRHETEAILDTYKTALGLA